ncbi:MAG: hypothetical protein AB8B80_05445 [Marinicellaceae bacterium]
MNQVKIYYKSEEDKYFENYEMSAQYYIVIDLQQKKVMWYYHLPLPKGMHWKAGDQMGGLGADHHNKSQTFEEFIENPFHEIPKDKYLEAINCIKTHT